MTSDRWLPGDSASGRDVRGPVADAGEHLRVRSVGSFTLIGGSATFMSLSPGDDNCDRSLKRIRFDSAGKFGEHEPLPIRAADPPTGCLAWMSRQLLAAEVGMTPRSTIAERMNRAGIHP